MCKLAAFAPSNIKDGEKKVIGGEEWCVFEGCAYPQDAARINGSSATDLKTASGYNPNDKGITIL